MVSENRSKLLTLRTQHTMALDQSALLDLLAQLKLTDVSDRIRSVTEVFYQELIDAEAANVIGAGKYERTDDRTTQRNGTRPRTLPTAAGDLELRIPKLRRGSFFPSLLERRRRVDQALFAVVMEAYLHGVSTRKVDDLVKTRGLGGVELVMSDAHSRLKKAITTVLQGAAWQRCWFHYADVRIMSMFTAVLLQDKDCGLAGSA